MWIFQNEGKGEKSEIGHLISWNELCPDQVVLATWMVQTFKEGDRKKMKTDFIILLNKVNSSSLINS